MSIKQILQRFRPHSEPEEEETADVEELIQATEDPAVIKALIAKLLELQKVHLVLLVFEVVFILSCAFAVSKIKQYAILRLMDRKPDERLGRLALFDKMINVIIFGVCVTFLLDLFNMDYGPGLQSLFAAGGIGALMFSLASKDLAEQVVGGLVLSVWEVFDQGDLIRLNESGIEGTVQRIGLADTEIRGTDNIVLKVPNSQIYKQRVSNYTKTKQSQVRQVLRFKYADLRNLSKIMNDIKDEIESSCSPSLIVDGSRPFRVYLFSYQEDHIEVIVNCHLNIPPNCGPYYEARQRVLEAIARAVAENNKTEFALPSIVHYRS